MITAAARHIQDAFLPHERNGYRPHILHHSALRVYAMVAVLVKVFAVLIITTYPAPSSTSNVTPNTIISLTNKERTRAGLRQLTKNALLVQGAEGKANDMVTKGYFSHNSPTNITPWYWFNRAGYKYSYAGENLAKDFVTAEDMVAAWMKSPSHRKNILNSRFKETGAAVGDGQIDGFNSLVAVQFFGEPLKQQTKTVQKPQPKPVVPTTPSAQVIQQQQQPKVLAEENAPLPPLAPSLTAPADGDIYTDGQLWVAGNAPQAVLINISVDGQMRVSIRSDALGHFRVQLPVALNDGRYSLTAQAVDQKTGLASPLSNEIGVTVDATPPKIDVDHVILLPSLASGQLDLSVPINGEADHADARLGSTQATLTRSGDIFHGVIDLKAKPSDATQLTVTATDPAGNSTTAVVADVSSIISSIIEPAQTTPFQTVINYVLFSQRFLVWLLAFLAIALSLKVFVRVRFQHHPTILYTLLLMYAVTVLMLI